MIRNVAGVYTMAWPPFPHLTLPNSDSHLLSWAVEAQSLRLNVQAPTAPWRKTSSRAYVEYLSSHHFLTGKGLRKNVKCLLFIEVSFHYLFPQRHSTASGLPFETLYLVTHQLLLGGVTPHFLCFPQAFLPIVYILIKYGIREGLSPQDGFPYFLFPFSFNLSSDPSSPGDIRETSWWQKQADQLFPPGGMGRQERVVAETG